MVGKAPIIPCNLSPNQVLDSPNGCAYDILIDKPVGCKKMPIYSPTPITTPDIMDKLKGAEERKQRILEEERLRYQHKGEKIQSIKRTIIDCSETKQKDIICNVQKKAMKSEEIANQIKKEAEEKAKAKKSREQEAKKIADDIAESRRKETEAKLALKQKIADDNVESARQAVIEKARQDILKVENLRAENKKKLDELDERVKKTEKEKEEKRLSYLGQIKEKCGRHVEDAKRRACEVKKQANAVTQT